MFLLFTKLFLLLRVIFAILFYNDTLELDNHLFWHSMILGFRFDLRLASILTIPFLLLSSLFPFKYDNIIWKLYWFLLGSVLLIIFGIDLGYFSYLNTRLDASIIGLVKNFSISMRMVWETYPIIKFFIILFILYFALWKLLNLIFKRIKLIGAEVSLFKTVLTNFIILIIIILIGYGKISSYPLRWSDAFYSTNHFANQLAINPVLYFLNTYSWKEEGYDIIEVEKHYKNLVKHFNIDTNSNKITFKKNIPAKKLPTKANIVIIILETFPNYKIGYFGNKLNPTPNFDKLAKESIVFTNFYVTKFSTAASVFSTVTGLPDVATVNKTSTNDPFSFKQHILLNDLKNYNKHFFIGGSANWADIGGFFRRNIKGITIFEEGSYNAKPINAWGISDYHLLQEANQVFRKENKPFSSVILTAGNHSPYSIPKVDGFNLIDFTKEHESYGFSSQKELNAFRFMDFALGEFFNSAKNEKYFKNTIFFILGDHGIGHKSQSNNYGALSLHNYQVPLIIFSPSFNIEHKIINDVASSIDVLPTVMGLLSQPYTNTALGVDLLKKNRKNYAFIFTASNSTHALISNNYVIINDVDENQYTYNFKTGSLITKNNNEINYMKNINKGYYHLAKYLRYHNE
tara:strand:+ start:610 stop:2499 length:1890 start_codon:yes stop_codon:yes gene_type:complete